MHNTSTEYNQMHNKTISWNDNWIIICFVGRLLLDHSTSSSSSFMKSSFLIQMIIWIRGSSRIESFIFLIVWGIFFESWELDVQLLPSSLLLLWVELLLVCALPRVCWKQSLPSGTHSSNEWIPCPRETIQGGHYNLCILHFFIHCFKLFFDLRYPCKVWLYGLCILDLHILQLVPQIHLLIYVLPFK